MQKVIFRSDIDKYRNEIDDSVVNYINDSPVETYESFENYSLIAFDWRDLNDINKDPSQILIYVDKDDLFLICEDENSYEAANRLFTVAQTNEKALYLFFKNMFKYDTKNLDRLEDKIADLDDAVMKNSDEALREQILDTRYELLQLKKYYEEFDALFEELCDDENEVISEEYIRYFGILGNRVSKLLSETINLKEYIIQVRESYQAQIDIEQNRLMKVFTLVTSIFLPLTLIAGWYGMNFINMPELTWKFGYLTVIGVSALVTLIWYIVFRKKGWFKG